jgi:hypothetical protein
MQASACPPTPRFLARKSSHLKPVPQVVTARSHAEMPLPGSKTGSKPEAAKRSAGSCATVLREPELPGVLRLSATRCHHRGLYLSRNAMNADSGCVSSAYLAQHMGQVPVRVIPCITVRSAWQCCTWSPDFAPSSERSPSCREADPMSLRVWSPAPAGPAGLHIQRPGPLEGPGRVAGG